MEIGRIRNKTTRLLTTPAVRGKDGQAGFPVLYLPPGGTNVPDSHLAALEGLDPTRGAGKVWAEWQAAGMVEVIRAKTPEAKAEVAKREGPEPPATLAEVKVDGAILLVQAEEDPKVLRMWAKAERRKDVKDAIQDRLAELVGD